MSGICRLMSLLLIGLLGHFGLVVAAMPQSRYLDDAQLLEARCRLLFDQHDPEPEVGQRELLTLVQSPPAGADVLLSTISKTPVCQSAISDALFAQSKQLESKRAFNNDLSNFLIGSVIMGAMTGSYINGHPATDSEWAKRESSPTAEERSQAHHASSVTLVPFFPWPPPYPYTSETLDRANFAQLRNLGELGNVLRFRLERAGFKANRFFSVGSDGFAVVTPIERVDASGQPLVGGDRWLTMEDGINNRAAWNLRDYLLALFYKPVGRYGIFVFVVTKQDLSFSGTELYSGLAQEWSERGTDRLPVTFGKIPLTDDYKIHVLVYQLERVEGKSASAIKKGSAHDLIARSNIDIGG